VTPGPFGRALALAVVLAAAAPALAHAPSTAHLRLDAEAGRLTGRIDVALRDLDAVLGLDADGDGDLTWGELDAAAPRVTAYVERGLAVTSGGRACSLAVGALALADLSDGTYAALPVSARCEGATPQLELAYALVFELDAHHRLLLHVAGQTRIVRDAAPVTIEPGGSAALGTFVREGIRHIWIGLDHVLFLLCLLLPSVLPGRNGAARLRDVIADVLATVTAFTLAHSITLVISAVGLVQLPARLVETAIAVSVVVAAVNNLVRAVDARWAVAFALGLLHGFGFSSVLLDLGLPPGDLVGALLGFNLGVELGQLAIVVVVLPLLYALRASLAYRVLLVAGSGAVAVLGVIWTAQRFVP
jgi:hypothetical protein